MPLSLKPRVAANGVEGVPRRGTGKGGGGAEERGWVRVRGRVPGAADPAGGRRSSGRSQRTARAGRCCRGRPSGQGRAGQEPPRACAAGAAAMARPGRAGLKEQRYDRQLRYRGGHGPAPAPTERGCISSGGDGPARCRGAVPGTGPTGRAGPGGAAGSRSRRGPEGCTGTRTIDMR